MGPKVSAKWQSSPYCMKLEFKTLYKPNAKISAFTGRHLGDSVMGSACCNVLMLLLFN